MNKFKSLYINTAQPKAIRKSEIVDVIDLNIIFDIHGISCDDLGICFVGDFEFEDDKELYMPIHDSWSMMRLTIDKKSYESSKTHLFTKGTHRVEIEWLSNWHTLNYYFEIN